MSSHLLFRTFSSPQHIRTKFAFTILVVDLLDASSTLVTKIRSVIGANPLFLVGTKADLLPSGTEPLEVAAWLSEFAAARQLAVAGTAVVSGTTGQGAFQTNYVYGQTLAVRVILRSARVCYA